MHDRQTLQVIDSHTAGEPTRTVVGGDVDLSPVVNARGKTLAERRALFRAEFDDVRSAIVNEPRGSEVLVGALLCEPFDASCAAGVIFFNNVGVIGMCGHGMMGFVVTLAQLGEIGAGRHRIETPVGVVECEFDGANGVAVRNVPSYRHQSNARVSVPEIGDVYGDIAWGGNWFYLVHDFAERIALDRAAELQRFTAQIRRALGEQNIAGNDGEEIDHIELCGPPGNKNNHGRNFVLCPGLAYDRSPCGTGTSAKLACLAAEGKLQPGEPWRQEGILGTVFEGSYERTVATEDRAAIIPTIRGEAFVTAEAKLMFDSRDPLKMGIRP